MKPVRLKTILLSALAGVLLLTQLAMAAEKTLVVLGDSLSAAYGIARDKGWVALLVKKLEEENYNYKVINESISGDTTAGGLSRLPAIIARQNLDLLIVELGANDGLRGYPLGQMKQNLKDIVSLGRQANAKVLLVGVEIPANYGRRYTDGFRQVYLDVAAEESVSLLPSILEGVPLKEEFFLGDRLHPDVTAQPLILANIWQELTKLIARS